MPSPRPSTLAFATAVVACELEQGSGSLDAEAFIGKLRLGLGKLIGTTGFDSILTRALRLAKKDEPSLAKATVIAGGLIEGLPIDPGDAPRSLIALLAHIHELLITFIGDDLARRVLQGIWPNVGSSVESKEREP